MIPPAAIIRIGVERSRRLNMRVTAITIIPFPERPLGLAQIEQLCLDFLRRTTNPLVPVDTLYEACARQGASISREELLSFLRNHANVLVVDGAGENEPLPVSELEDAGINLGPRAILKLRLPSRAEMTDMLEQQLQQMRFHLQEALDKARENKDADAVRDIEAALERGKELERKMRGFIGPGKQE